MVAWSESPPNPWLCNDFFFQPLEHTAVLYILSFPNPQLGIWCYVKIDQEVTLHSDFLLVQACCSPTHEPIVSKVWSTVIPPRYQRWARCQVIKPPSRIKHRGIYPTNIPKRDATRETYWQQCYQIGSELSQQFLRIFGIDVQTQPTTSSDPSLPPPPVTQNYGGEWYSNRKEHPKIFRVRYVAAVLIWTKVEEIHSEKRLAINY